MDDQFRQYQLIQVKQLLKVKFGTTQLVILLKVLLVNSAWSSSAPISTARYSHTGVGTQTAGLIIGGNTPTTTATTEEYNGSGWTGALYPT